MIHAKRDEDGKISFRIWDSRTGKYATEEMSSEELRNHLLKGKLEEFLLRQLEQIDVATEIAARRGFSQTSENEHPFRTLESPWEGKKD